MTARARMLPRDCELAGNTTIKKTPLFKKKIIDIIYRKNYKYAILQINSLSYFNKNKI